MSKTVHMCIDVRGMLNWPLREARKNLKWITKDDGTPFRDVHEFRHMLMDELAKGHEVLPLQNPPCEGFDFKRGCPGHEVNQ